MPNQMLTSVRTGLDDTSTNKYVGGEDLSNQIFSGNLIFRIGNGNIVTASEKVIVDGVVLVNGVGYTLNNATGQLTLVVAPVATIRVSYNWQDFSDDEITDFIGSGVQHVGYRTSTDPSTTFTDLALVPVDLQTAVEHYALFHGFSTLAAKTARLFIAGSGKKNINKDNIAKKYLELANFHQNQGDTDRDDYYKRQGRRNAPAFAANTVNYPTNTPRR